MLRATGSLHGVPVPHAPVDVTQSHIIISSPPQIARWHLDSRFSIGQPIGNWTHTHVSFHSLFIPQKRNANLSLDSTTLPHPNLSVNRATAYLHKHSLTDRTHGATTAAAAATKESPSLVWLPLVWRLYNGDDGSSDGFSPPKSLFSTGSCILSNCCCFRSRCSIVLHTTTNNNNNTHTKTKYSSPPVIDNAPHVSASFHHGGLVGVGGGGQC